MFPSQLGLPVELNETCRPRTETPTLKPLQTQRLQVFWTQPYPTAQEAPVRLPSSTRLVLPLDELAILWQVRKLLREPSSRQVADGMVAEHVEAHELLHVQVTSNFAVLEWLPVLCPDVPLAVRV